MLNLVRCFHWSDDRLEEELFIPMKKDLPGATIINQTWKTMVFDLLKSGFMVEFVDNKIIFRVPIDKKQTWTCNSRRELAFLEEGPHDYFMDAIIEMIWPRGVMVT